jgi:hypothetical protein
MRSYHLLPLAGFRAGFIYVVSIRDSRQDGHIHNMGARDKIIEQAGIFVNGSRQRFGIQLVSGNLDY